MAYDSVEVKKLSYVVLDGDVPKRLVVTKNNGQFIDIDLLTASEAAETYSGRELGYVETEVPQSATDNYVVPLTLDFTPGNRPVLVTFTADQLVTAGAGCTVYVTMYNNGVPVKSVNFTVAEAAKNHPPYRLEHRLDPDSPAASYGILFGVLGGTIAAPNAATSVLSLRAVEG